MTLLCNAEATIAGVCGALADLAQRVTPADTVLVFFGGHGALDTDGAYTFATHETRFVNERILAGTGLSAPELLALLRAISAQKMLVLVNTCFSGHLHPRLGNVSPRGSVLSEAVGVELLAAGEGQAVLTASRSEQFSHYLHREQRTFFGEALVQALRGAGLPPLSGLIGLYELYQQVYNEVSEAAAVIGEKQEPVLTILQGVGPFPVAHYRGATATDPSLLQPAPPALPSLNLQTNAQIEAGSRWISFSFSFTIHTGKNPPPNSSTATLPFTQTATPSVANTARYRSYIIEQVRRQWIDGLLQHSLGQKAKIALTYQVRLDLVEVVLAAQVQELQRLSLQPKASTSPAAIFEQLGGTMLIVGAPGGGKTTLLLEIARELLGRAVADMRQSVPVVFNLSSWGKDSLPLEEWLTRELNRLYDVPHDVGRRWINDDALIAMLDGLDEVAPVQRAACVDAINTYLRKHGLGSLAVCCRAADYTEIGRKVRLNGALVIQPLNEQQIEQALSADGKLATLRAALEHDSALRELATSPLMLSVMALAYESLSPDSLGRAATVEERRQHLFDVYITNMLERGSPRPPSIMRKRVAGSAGLPSRWRSTRRRSSSLRDSSLTGCLACPGEWAFTR